MQPSKSNASGWHALKIIWVGDNITPKSLVPLNVNLDKGENSPEKLWRKGKKKRKLSKIKKPIGRFLFNLLCLDLKPFYVKNISKNNCVKCLEDENWTLCICISKVKNPS